MSHSYFLMWRVLVKLYKPHHTHYEASGLKSACLYSWWSDLAGLFLLFSNKNIFKHLNVVVYYFLFLSHAGLPPEVCNFSVCYFCFSDCVIAVPMSAELYSLHKANVIYCTNSNSRPWICNFKFPFAPVALFASF